MSEKIELRSYQKNQINFIERKMKSGIGAAIKSPTGSGKSFVILEYVRRLIEENKGRNFTVVVSTGFNNLVYQLAEDAPKFGLNPMIWVGTGHLMSEKKYKEANNLPDEYILKIDEHQAFTDDPSLRLSGNKKCGTSFKCDEYKRTGHMCLYHQLRAKMKSVSSGPKFIITNHSSYLFALKYNTFNPDVAIMDESHTFASYYESYNTTKIPPNDIRKVQEMLDESDPAFMLFRRAIDNGLLINTNLIKNIHDKIIAKNKKLAPITALIGELSLVEPNINNYIEISPEVGIEITNFWSKFDIKQDEIDYLLVSATQDSFTLRMFEVPKSNLYVEMDCNTINYRESDFVVYKEPDYAYAAKRFLGDMREKGYSKGLMLSTTNKDVRYLKTLGELEGYKVITDKDDFMKSEGPCVLAGSRVLFQGVDIPNLDFVSLNRIPFPRYDEKHKAMEAYIENVTRLDAWSTYTIPKVSNELIQSTGRLWRKPGDKGTIAIFDERLDEKFSNMVKTIQRERAGIKIEILETNNPAILARKEEIEREKAEKEAEKIRIKEENKEKLRIERVRKQEERAKEKARIITEKQAERQAEKERKIAEKQAEKERKLAEKEAAKEKANIE